MNFFAITLIIIFFLSLNLFSQDVRIIELHPYSADEESIQADEESIQNEIYQEELADEAIFSDGNEINANETNATEDESVEEELIIDTISNEGNEINANENNETDDENLTEKNVTTEILKDDEKNQNNVDESIVVSMSSYWENSSRDDLDFLFNNVNASTSKVINSYFIDILTGFSKAPKSYTQEEFDNLRIKTLLMMGYKQEALTVLNNIITYEAYKNYYDHIKLDSYLATYALPEACSFKDSLQEFNENKNNIILKVSIFCSFLENKLEEADLLNSLLLDTQDKDEYFQNIYFNLKNNINKPITITQGSFDESSFSLYSAMIRIGSLPFTKQFLEFDSTNLTLPIILSPSTDISLRLISAHKAYELGLFNAESLSALYQSVDFSLEELNNWKESLKNYTQKPEIGMALLFQNARVQLLPITRLESLKEFWNYAVMNDLEKLAYDVSRNLIESTEPSVELSDYSILLARAHIFNKNFQQAEKWILFVENHISQSSEFEQVKFLYNLKKSENKDIFIKSLENNLIAKIKKEETLEDYNEILRTIFSIILNEKNIVDKINDERKIVDERSMPSIYIINTINNSLKNSEIGELILTALVSLENKSWNDVHPQHLKILLESFKKAKLDNLFKDIIIEIFEESKII